MERYEENEVGNHSPKLGSHFLTYVYTQQKQHIHTTSDTGLLTELILLIS